MKANKCAMDEIVHGLPTKSAKIRALAKKGIKQAEIARFLNIKDQFVSNVVRGPTPKSEQLCEDSPATTASPKRLQLQIGPGGRIVIPAVFREAMEISEGDTINAWVEDGEMHLLTSKVGLKKAKKLLQGWMAKDESLADELMDDRRREARE